MPERWERELDELRHIGDARTRDPRTHRRGPTGNRGSSRKHSLVAGIVAGAVAVAGIAALWQLDRNPGGTGTEPAPSVADTSSPAPGSSGSVVVDIRRSSEDSGSPGATARFGAQEQWMCPDHWTRRQPRRHRGDRVPRLRTERCVPGAGGDTDRGHRGLRDAERVGRRDREPSPGHGRGGAAARARNDHHPRLRGHVGRRIRGELLAAAHRAGLGAHHGGAGHRRVDLRPGRALHGGADHHDDVRRRDEARLHRGVRVDAPGRDEGRRGRGRWRQSPALLARPAVPRAAGDPDHRRGSVGDRGVRDPHDDAVLRRTRWLRSERAMAGEGEGDFTAVFEVVESDAPTEVELDCADADQIPFAPPKGARILPGGSAYVRGNILGVLPHDVVEQMTREPNGETEWDGVWQIVRDGSVVAAIDFPSLGGVACRGSGIQEI